MFGIASVVGYVLFAVRMSATDLKYRVVRNRVLIHFALFSLAANYRFITANNFRQFIFVILVLVAINQIFHGKIGAGDLKLLLVLALWSHDFISWLQFFTIACALAGIASGISALSIWGFEEDIPFAPFIFGGFFAATLALIP